MVEYVDHKRIYLDSLVWPMYTSVGLDISDLLSSSKSKPLSSLSGCFHAYSEFSVALILPIFHSFSNISSF